MAKIAFLMMCTCGLWVFSHGPVAAADVRIAMPSLSASPSDPFARTRANDVRAALFDGLTRFDKNGALAPALAASWKNTMPTAWRFVLRRDVTFSNGEPLTAAAVVTTVTWLQTPEGRAAVPDHALQGLTADADTDDIHVVVLHTVKPDPILPRRLAHVMIVAPQAWADLGHAAYARAPVTTGPFRIGEVGPGKITLVANPDSWRKPAADHVVITAMADRAARIKALLAGQIDIATDIGVDDISALETNNLLTAVTPATAVMAIAFRQAGRDDSPLHDVRVRRAINYAVDKNALNGTVLRGLGAAAGQPAARDVEGYAPEVKAYPYDPDKAKALLADAGHGDGLKLRIAVTVDQYAGDRALYQAVVDVLAKVGITLELAVIADDVWSKSVDSGDWDPDVEGFSMPFDATATHDVSMALEDYSCLKLVPFVCDQDLTARLVGANQTVDVERRANGLNDLAHAFHDDPPALYLVDAFDLYGVGRKIDGFAVADRTPVYENIAPVARKRP